MTDALPKMLWCRHFVEAQEYLVENMYVYQDNESVILLETNGMKSVGKSSRSTGIKYFFVTNKVKGKELKIMHCPTDQIVTCFYTIPLQGSAFIRHKNSILGIEKDNIPQYNK